MLDMMILWIVGRMMHRMVSKVMYGMVSKMMHRMVGMMMVWMRHIMMVRLIDMMWIGMARMVLMWIRRMIRSQVLPEAVDRLGDYPPYMLEFVELEVESPSLLQMDIWGGSPLSQHFVVSCYIPFRCRHTSSYARLRR